MTDDGDPFNAGWNAALDEAVERIKKMSGTAFSGAPGVLIMIAKADVLALLRADGEKVDKS